MYRVSRYRWFVKQQVLLCHEPTKVFLYKWFDKISIMKHTWFCTIVLTVQQLSKQLLKQINMFQRFVDRFKAFQNNWGKFKWSLCNPSPGATIYHHLSNITIFHQFDQPLANLLQGHRTSHQCAKKGCDCKKLHAAIANVHFYTLENKNA